MKLFLLIVAVAMWAIGAILVLISDSLGSLGALDFFLLGAPFFAASFLPIR